MEQCLDEPAGGAAESSRYSFGLSATSNKDILPTYLTAYISSSNAHPGSFSQARAFSTFGTLCPDDIPDSWGVLCFDRMAQFVHDDAVENKCRCLDQPPVESDVVLHSARIPSIIEFTSRYHHVRRRAVRCNRLL